MRDSPPEAAPDPWLVPGALVLVWANALPSLMVYGLREPTLSLRILMVSALLSVAWAGVRRLGLVGTSWLLWVLVVGVATLDALVLQLFGHRLTPAVVFVVFETNPREALEFVQMYLDGRVAWLLAVVLAPLPLGVALRNRGAVRSLGGLAALVGLAWLAGGIWTEDFPPAALIQALFRYREETAAYYQLKAQLLPAQASASVTRPPPEALYVLVLGESTGRHHLGLYGYGRDTSPRLGRLGDELLVFRDVVSHQSHTQPAMKELVTFFNQESTRPWQEHATLLGALRGAGYETYWLSNQEMYGLWANVTGALASQADVKLFHKHRKSEGTEAAPVLVTTRDEELVPYLARIAALPPDRARFVVVHLMGTHGWYGNRYPAAFARFDGTALPDPDRPWLTPAKRRAIDQYDDAVLYNDQVVAALIETVAKAGRNSFVLYVSDHGEEVYDSRDFLGHTDQVGTRFMIEVPMLLWMSPGFLRQNPAKAVAAGAARDKPFMTDDLPHLVLDLAGAAHPDLEPARSLVNPAYRADRPRTYAGRSYDCELREPASPRCPTQSARLPPPDPPATVSPSRKEHP